MDASNQPMLTQLVVSALRKYGLWDQSLVVGVSGGMDSMALLEALKQGRGASNVKVAHVNFKLRGQESDRDQGLVEAYCHQHGIECHSFDASTRTGIPKTGVQEWAREVRKEIFKVHFPHHAICLGHHRDDLAESVVFRLVRGHQPDQLAGMVEYGPPYFRPFLSITRWDIQEFIRRHDVPYGEDSSNAKLIYSRNRIRHQVLPVLEEISPGASKKLIHMAEDIRELVEWVSKSCGPELEKQGACLPRSWLKEFPRVLQMKLMAEFVDQQSQSLTWLPHELGRKVLQSLEHDNGGQWPLPGESLALLKEEGFLRVIKRSKAGSRRAKQHLLNHQREHWAGVLPAEAEAIISLDRGYRIVNHTPKGLNIEISGISSYKNVMFNVEDKRWSLGTLRKLWQIDLHDFSRFKLIYISNTLQALFDGTKLFQPGRLGEKIVLEDWCLSIQNLEASKGQQW